MKNRKMKGVALCALINVASVPAYAGSSNVEGLELSSGAVLGYNSNVYHTPSAPYVDLAQPGNPVVVPNVQSGLFVPMNLDAKYQMGSGIEMGYQFDSNFFLGSALKNANTYDNDIKLGKNFEPNDSEFYLGIFAGMHKKLYVDRDTGEEKLTRVAGANVSNRYNYKNTGLEAKFKTKVSGMDVVANVSTAKLTYDNPIAISSLSHTLNKLGGYVRIPVVAKKVKVKLGYDYMSRDYDIRKARNLAARLVASNPALSYTYQTLSSQLLWKMDKHIMMMFDLAQAKRTDKFVGYNDYTNNKMKLRLRYKFDNNAFIRGKLAYNKIDYANAFAFENTAAPRKTSKTMKASIKAEHKLASWGEPALWASLDYKKVTANDLRYDYKLTEMIVGGDWAF